jgi:hypothetical protein
MLNIGNTDLSPGGVAAERTYATRAAGSVAAVVEAGALILIAEPWRIARIVRAADDMTAEELAGEIARRRRLAPPADINRAIAFAQLALALKSPRFCMIWAAWRLRCAKEPVDKGLIFSGSGN